MAPRLRSADQLISPALDVMIADIDPPAADGPLVALARRQAALIDGMPDAVALAMLPQFSGQLVKALAELEARAARRRGREPGRPNRVAQLRAARVMADASRRGRG